MRLKATILCLLLVGFAASSAFAVTITKPQNNETAISVNQAESAVVTNSGHYATASGTPYPYVWSATPPNSVIWDTSPDPVYRHTIRFMCQPDSQYSPILISVFDTGDGSLYSITIYPVRLSWVDNGGGSPNRDRLVHIPELEVPAREREVSFIAYGQKSIQDLRIREHRNTKEGQLGTGTVDITRFDGDDQAVGGGQGGGGAMKEFRVVIPVATSISGTTHTLGFQGADRSSFMDDIEIDLVNNLQGSTIAYDGIGCVMDYTVFEWDLEVAGTHEASEEFPGAFLETNFADVAVVKRAVPDDITGYQTGLYSSPGSATNFTGYVANAGPGDNALGFKPYPGVQIPTNQGLAWDFVLYGGAGSTQRRDGDLNIVLLDAGQEVGGGTCRDRAAITVVDVDIVSYQVTTAAGNGVYNCVVLPPPDEATFYFDGNVFATVSSPGSTFTIPCNVHTMDGKEAFLTAEIDGNDFECIAPQKINRVSRTASLSGSYTLWVPNRAGGAILPYPNNVQFDLFGTRLVPRMGDSIAVTGLKGNYARIADGSNTLTQDGARFYWWWNTAYAQLGYTPFWAGNVSYTPGGPAAVPFLAVPVTPAVMTTANSVAPANSATEVWTAATVVTGTATVSHGVGTAGGNVFGGAKTFVLNLGL